MKNNRGYVLVEIILASALAFGIAYFMISMTIKLKNKNDDLLVETLTTTDQAIIMNSIMKDLKGTDCSVVADRLKINGNKVFVDGGVIDVVNDYVTVGVVDCKKENNIVTVILPLTIPQIKDKDFDIELNWVLNS